MLHDPKLSPAVESKLAAVEAEEDIVGGYVEVRDASGKVLASRLLNKAQAPNDVERLVETGDSDAEGFAYTAVSGAQGDEQFEMRYQYIQRFRREAAPSALQVTVPEKPTDVRIGQEIQNLLRSQAPTGEVDIYIGLKSSFTTRLKPASASRFSSLAAAERDYVERHASFSARKAEAESLQATTTKALSDVGAHNVAGLWISNGIAARVPASSLPAIVKFDGLESIDIDPGAPTNGSTEWDGHDIKASGGLNAGIYDNSGYDGIAWGRLGGDVMCVSV